MKDEKNNDHIVKPQTVDLNKVQIEESNAFNRERANIESASIQANESIDETKAKNVNNTIQNSTHNKVSYTLVVLFFLCLVALCLFFAYRLTKHLMQEETTTTTTTTKRSETDAFLSYFNDGTRVRKYQSEHYILLLGQYNVDLHEDKHYYLLLQTSESGILSKKEGAYTSSESALVLDGETYSFNELGISYLGETLVKKDTEMKYYQYQDDDISLFLLINGTLQNEYAEFILSTKESTTIYSGNYTETTEEITLSSYVFKKNNEGVLYQNYTLQMYS